MRNSIRTSNYLEIIVVSDPTHISVVDYVAIRVKTLRIDSVCSKLK